MVNEKNKFSGQIEDSARRLIKSRKEKGGFWHYASVFGIGGWLFAIPIVVGAYLGRYLDKNIRIGVSWTLMLIFVGIAAGIFNFWRYVSGRESDKWPR